MSRLTDIRDVSIAVGFVGLLGLGLYLDETGFFEEDEPEPVPAYIQYGDPDQPVYEREWGK